MGDAEEIRGHGAVPYRRQAEEIRRGLYGGSERVFIGRNIQRTEGLCPPHPPNALRVAAWAMRKKFGGTGQYRTAGRRKKFGGGYMGEAKEFLLGEISKGRRGSAPRTPRMPLG